MSNSLYDKYAAAFRAHIPKVFPFMLAISVFGTIVNTQQQNEIVDLQAQTQRSETALNGFMLTQTNMDATAVLEFAKHASQSGHLNKDHFPAYYSPYDFEQLFNSQSDKDRKRFILEMVQHVREPKYTPLLYIEYGSKKRENKTYSI